MAAVGDAGDDDDDVDCPATGWNGREDNDTCRWDRRVSRHTCRSHHTVRLSTALYNHPRRHTNDSETFQASSHFIERIKVLFDYLLSVNQNPSIPLLLV